MKERRKLLHLALVVGLILICSRQASAFLLFESSSMIYVPQATNGGGATWLDPSHEQYLPPGDPKATTAKSLIEAGFPSYTVTISSSALPGTVGVNAYEAYQVVNAAGTVDGAGAIMDFDYLTSNPILADVRYLQVIWTTKPSPGKTSPYLDGPTPPFYYDAENEPKHRSYETYNFHDGPQRPYNGTEVITWHAATFLVDVATPGTINIHDGVYWGWKTLGALPGGGGNSPSRAATPVPEPTTGIVLFLGTVLFARRRRR